MDKDIPPDEITKSSDLYLEFVSGVARAHTPFIRKENSFNQNCITFNYILN
jgi:hypothetical protein